MDGAATAAESEKIQKGGCATSGQCMRDDNAVAPSYGLRHVYVIIVELGDTCMGILYRVKSL
jgi:hypothetical protein